MPPPGDEGLRKCLIIATTALIVQVAAFAALLYASPHYWKQPYHTSALSGLAWVNELKMT
jgi:hypothetical protein